MCLHLKDLGVGEWWSVSLTGTCNGVVRTSSLPLLPSPHTQQRSAHAPSSPALRKRTRGTGGSLWCSLTTSSSARWPSLSRAWSWASTLASRPPCRRPSRARLQAWGGATSPPHAPPITRSTRTRPLGVWCTS